MCDPITDRENEAYLSRRQLSLGGAAALLTGCAPKAAPPEASGSESGISRRKVTIETPDGQADGVFIAPTSGTAPGVLMWPDVAGLRPAFEGMASRLASAGYAVLLVNPYYRSAKGVIFEEFSQWPTDAGRARTRPMIEALTPDAIDRDAAAFVAWLDAQPQVDRTRKIGTQGYCMTGSFTFRVAAAVPDRVGAIASFHGGGLVTEAEDSPHRLLATMNAVALICIGQNDHERAPEAKPALEQAAADAGRTAEIEVYDANHGWCVLDSPVYEGAEAERAWARLLATYTAHL